MKAGLTSTNSGTLTVVAAAATLSLNPASVSGGETSTGTFTLTTTAPSDVTVPLSSSNTALVTMPSSVTIPAGSTTGTFQITTLPVTTTTPITIKATYSSAIYTATLTLTPPATLASLTLTPLVVNGNSGSATGNVNLISALQGVDTVINLSSDDPSVVIPTTVTIPAGSISTAFTATVPNLSGFTKAILTASRGTVSKQAMLTVLVPHITAPIADPGSYTYPASAPVVFNGWAQTLNNQALDFRWVPYDPADSGGTTIVLPGPTRMTWTPGTPQMRLVVTVAGSPQPAVMDSVNACSGVMPGSCAWRAITLVPNRSCPAPGLTLLLPTVTGLTNFVSGSPPTFTATQFAAGDRYSWVLEIEDPPGSDRYRKITVTQACRALPATGSTGCQPRLDAETRRKCATGTGALSFAVSGRSPARELLLAERLVPDLFLHGHRDGAQSAGPRARRRSARRAEPGPLR